MLILNPTQNDDRRKIREFFINFSLTNLLTKFKDEENDRYYSSTDMVLLYANLEKLELIQNGRNQFTPSHHDRAHSLHMILFTLFYLYSLEVKIASCKEFCDDKKENILKGINDMIHLLEDCFIILHISISDYLDENKENGIYGLFKNEIKKFKIEYQYKLQNDITKKLQNKKESLQEFNQDTKQYKGIILTNCEKHIVDIASSYIYQNTLKIDLPDLVDRYKSYRNGIWVMDNNNKPKFIKFSEIINRDRKLCSEMNLNEICEKNQGSQNMVIHDLSSKLNSLTSGNNHGEKVNILNLIMKLCKNFIQEEIFRLLWPMYNAIKNVSENEKKHAQNICSEKVKFLNKCISLFFTGKLNNESKLTLLTIMENHMGTAMSYRYNNVERIIKIRSQKMSDKYEIFKNFKDLQDKFQSLIDSIDTSSLKEEFKEYSILRLKDSMNEIYTMIENDNYAIHYAINSLKRLMEQIENTIKYVKGEERSFDFFYWSDRFSEKIKKRVNVSIQKKEKFNINIDDYSGYDLDEEEFYNQLFYKLENFFGDGFYKYILVEDDKTVKQIKYSHYVFISKNRNMIDQNAYFQEVCKDYNEKIEQYKKKGRYRRRL